MKRVCSHSTRHGRIHILRLQIIAIEDPGIGEEVRRNEKNTGIDVKDKPGSEVIINFPTHSAICALVREKNSYV